MPPKFTKLTELDMRMALYTLHVNGWSRSETINQYDWINQDMEPGEDYNEWVRRYEGGLQILRKYFFIATEHLPLSGVDAVDYNSLTTRIPKDCAGYFPIFYNPTEEWGESVRVFLFFNRKNNRVDQHKTLLFQLIRSLEEGAEVYTMSHLGSEITVQRISQSKYYLNFPYNASVRPFIGYCFEVWAAILEIESETWSAR